MLHAESGQVPHGEFAELTRGRISIKILLRDTAHELALHESGMVHVRSQGIARDAIFATRVKGDEVLVIVEFQRNVRTLCELLIDLRSHCILMEGGCGLDEDGANDFEE